MTRPYSRHGVLLRDQLEASNLDIASSEDIAAHGIELFFEISGDATVHLPINVRNALSRCLSMRMSEGSILAGRMSLTLYADDRTADTQDCLAMGACWDVMMEVTWRWSDT